MGKKTHNKTISDIFKRKKYGPVSLEAIRKYLDPNAMPVRTKGKRKYLMPMDKKMRKIILPLAKPYPKSDKDEL